MQTTEQFNNFNLVKHKAFAKYIFGLTQFFSNRNFFFM